MDFIRRGRGERYKTLDKHEGENLPNGMWEKCHGCRELIYVKDLDANWRVCPRCTYHHNLTVGRRVELLVDAGSWQEMDHHLRPLDALDFTIRGKHYAQRLPEAEASAGVPEAVISGRATLDGLPVVLAVMVIDFLGGTVGAVAGEKIARAAERAGAEGRGLIIVSQSGGMRLHEGTTALMQMAKAGAALARLDRSGVPYISLIADQTYGGTTASWASLGDVILAEPGARIGFSGPRVLQAVKVKLPEETQRAEFMLEHGMLDAIVPRSELRQTLTIILRHYGGKLAAARPEPVALADLAAAGGA
ncbi:MAG TPA: acetyl-CoA carboxylase carboxyltransferase subunit beta [Chloroflexota bacterium]